MNSFALSIKTAVVGLFVLGVGMDSHAQTNQPALEEIVVTAQKRSENLQEIPIAITALSVGDLVAASVTDTLSFANLVPNLHIKQGTTGSATIAIRGISNNNASNPGYENTVGMYIDSVYVGKAFGALFDLGDIGRVEVLRGPQGTLYGRNSIGGAINIIGTAPSGELGGSLQVGAGSDSLLTAKGSLDLPTIGTANEGLGELNTRFSFYTRERDGITDNVGLAFIPEALPVANFSRFGDVSRQGLRAAFDWNIRDNFSLSYGYRFSDVDDTSRLFQVLDVDRPGSRPDNFEAYIIDGHPSRGAANVEIYIGTEIETHSLTATWDINDNLQLKSITGYRTLDIDESQDLDGSDTGFFEALRDWESDTFSQEVHLVGSTDQLNYVLGVYYADEEVVSLRTQQFASATFHRVRNGWLDNDNKAAFFQTDWTPSGMDALTLSFGARYTEETKSINRVITNFFGGSGSYTIQPLPPELFLPEINFDNTSIMAAAKYSFTDSLNGYVKYSEGFRSGGYDAATNPRTLEAASVPFDSEELKNYEIGIKSRWMDNRLQINMSAFFTEYDDQQLNSFDGEVSTTFNAGKIELYGMEFESVLLATEALRFGLNFALLNYDIKEFDLGVIIGDVADIAELNNAPKSTLNFTVDYNFAGLELEHLDFHLNYNYSDTAHAIAISTDGSPPNAEMDSRSLVDARLTLSEVQIGQTEFELALWGKNLADKEWRDNIIDFGSFRGGTYGDQRTYGVEATLNF